MYNNNIILKIIRRREMKKRVSEYKPFESSSIGDLAFLLLIFFIVTGSFVLRQGIFFSLPSQTAGSVKLEEKLIVDVYPQDNGFQYNEDIMNREAFKDMLTERKNESSEVVLIIHMKQQVKYDRLVDTLSIAKEAGIKRISLKNISGEG